MSTSHINKDQPISILTASILLISLLLMCNGAVALQASADLPDILSQQSSGKVPHLPDYSFAGYKNGLISIPVADGSIVNVRDFGAVPDDGKDDSRAVQDALVKAHSTSGPVIVRFEAGKYRITEILRIERSTLVLQGAGSEMGGTTLFFPRPMSHIDKSSSLDELREYLKKEKKFVRYPEYNINELFSEYSWSGGFIWVQKPDTRPASYLEKYDEKPKILAKIQSGKRGDTTLTVQGKASIKPGDVIQLQWLNRDGPEAGIIKSLYAAEYKSAGRHHWNFPERPLVRQSTKITSVNNGKLTIADPLLHDINDSIPAHIAAWEYLEHVGIEDLRIEFPDLPYLGHHLERGNNGIYFTSSYDSWVRNVRITNADSGLLSYNSANLTFQNIVTDGKNRAHYGIHLGNVHNVLAENIAVMNSAVHSLSFNTQSTKCVFKDAQVFADPALDQHSGANHQNLYDNVTLYMTASKSEDGPVVPVYFGGGAPYWRPGHGVFNTTWNLRVIVVGGAYPGDIVTVEGLTEGPLANIVGLHGNREFKLDYRPTPYLEKLNVELQTVPSLYTYQLTKRLERKKLDSK